MTLPFSILIPTWNNLPFLKLCVASIRRNSAAQHQIIIHVNDGSDGTLEWVRSEGLDYTHTDSNVGVCLAVNMMRTKVKTDYLFYLNDDMYLLPGWDTALSDEVNRLPDNRFFLSGTMIQPHNSLDVGILANYGDTIGWKDAFARIYERNGDAVAIGSKVAFDIALKKGLIDTALHAEAINILHKQGLTTDFPKGMDMATLNTFMLKDKKNKDGNIRFILPTARGKAEIFNLKP